jgi:long-chain fatty acid transport protein
MSINKSKLAKSKLALAMAAAAGLTFSSGAFATNGILQAGNGMVAHGMGGAGLANAGEAAAGMDNPALISDTGDAVNVGWSVFMPDRQWSYFGVDFKSDNKMFAIPQIAFTSKINSSLNWGIMAYALGGMNTDYRQGLFGPGSSTVDLSGMIVAPTMSYALNKDISFGGSLLVAYENFRGRNVLGSGNADEGSTTGYGVKLGANWKITDGIAVGATVQPKLSMGEISWWKNFVDTAPNAPSDSALTLPNEFGIGGKFAVGKNVDIVADLMYYQWSDVDIFKFFGWDDQTVLKLGAEFRPSEKLALRAGFNYGKSPIQGDVLPPAGGGFATAVMLNSYFPAVSEYHFTLGMGYKLDKNMAFNAYYLYSPKTSISDSITPVEISMSQNAFGVGINYATK